MLIFKFWHVLTAASAVFAASWIESNTVWYDTDGQKIQAHGGGIVQRGDTFYWVGHSSNNSRWIQASLTV